MKPIWLYDGVCVLCSRAVRYVMRYERRPEIRFVAIQSTEGRALAARFGIDPDNPDTFLFVEGSEAHGRSDGVLALLRHVGGPARLLLIGRLLPVRWRDRVYDAVAKNRYRLFGRYDSCPTVPVSERHRFTLPDLP